MKTIERTTEPFTLDAGSDTGILLIHGFTGSPSELRRMGHYLHQEGFSVHAPLLAGHGQTPEMMRGTDHRDWYQSALDGLEYIQQLGVSRVIACGLSMGGIISLKLASEGRVDGVIPMSAPIYIRNRKAWLTHVLKYFVYYIPRGSEHAEHIENEIVPLDRTPLYCVSSLLRLIRSVKRHLSDVTVPAFVVQSGQDETVVPRSAHYIYEHIRSKPKELKYYPTSSHIITLDRERELLYQDVVRFIKQHIV